MPENNQILSVEGQLIGMPTAGPESFSQQQLDYLKRALGVDETVLWTGSEAMSGNPTLLLSESCKNFEFIAIYGHAYSTWGEIEFVRINPTANSNSSETSMCISNLGASGNAVRFNQCQLNWSGLTSIAVTSANQFSITSTGVSVGTAASTFTKIVGIHRIAGGN